MAVHGRYWLVLRNVCLIALTNEITASKYVPISL
jgi:hypothetical protein